MISLKKLFWIPLVLTSFIAISATTNPQLKMITELGSITLEIYVHQAPITAGNFLRYVDDGFYTNATFFRTVTLENQPNDNVKIEVIQAGQLSTKSPYSPIAHETTQTTGIKHVDGAISMARGQPGSASSSFFICIGDQPELDYGGKRNPDGQGFAAFGKVIEGMDIVKKIQASKHDKQSLKPPIKILKICRMD